MLTCRALRWQIDTALDEDQPLSTSVLSHLEDCEDCRRHYQSQKDLVTSLRREKQTSSPATEEVVARIMTGVRRAGPAPTSRRLPLFSAAAAAACLLLAIGVQLHLERKAELRRTEQAALAESVTRLSTALFGVAESDTENASSWQTELDSALLAGTTRMTVGESTASPLNFFNSLLPPPSPPQKR